MSDKIDKDLEKFQKNRENQRVDENQRLGKKIEEALVQKPSSSFLRAYKPKPVDEAQAQMERAFKNQDALEESYRNATKNAIPDITGDIDVNRPGEVDGKADNPDEEKKEKKSPSSLPKLKPPGASG